MWSTLLKVRILTPIRNLKHLYIDFPKQTSAPVLQFHEDHIVQYLIGKVSLERLFLDQSASGRMLMSTTLITMYVSAQQNLLTHAF